MAWTYLVLAGLFEIGFAATLKLTENFTKLWPTLVFAVCIVLSFTFLERSLKEIPISTVWTGIGAAGTALVGILVYKEPATALRLFFIMTLIASIVGLKFATK
ncbi:MAG: DMT family transporter [Methyloceanibacter sp.]|uniref:DMT family transporter n=1 Tax=Methyloceanibacter sp. TaxID=1965321 RepID=UPI003D9BF4EE